MGLKTSRAKLALATALGVLLSARVVAQPAAIESPDPLRNTHATPSSGINQTPPASTLCPRPRQIHAKPATVRFWPGLYRDRVVVKLRDNAGLRLNRIAGTGLAIFMSSASETPAAELEALNSLLAEYRILAVRGYFSTAVERLHDIREAAQARSCAEQPELSGYYWISLQAGSRGEEVAIRLNRSPMVEIAYLPPIPRNADIAPPTADMQASQGYLLPARDGGIDAFAAWALSGGRGAGMRVVDVEANWNVNHEDLRAPFWFSGIPGLNEVSNWINDKETTNTNHGTAVVGVLAARNDRHGITGIASDAEWGGASVISPNALTGIPGGTSGIHDASVADAIVRATEQLRIGDVILVEQHSQGPPTATSCTSNCTQFEYVPMEYFPASFDAISTATASGIHVVEAAGNGSVNLDRDEYEGRFDRHRRDSGAILVGASLASSFAAAAFSNRGSRVDLNGWGENVATTGYGDIRANGDDTNQFYTATFSGTSSASAIVAGAVLAIEGVLRASGQGMLEPAQMRRLLVDTGSRQFALDDVRQRLDAVARAPGLVARAADLRLAETTAAKLIGVRPDLRRALDGFASATALAGGGGGDPYSLRCPGGQALVGLKVRAGWFIDQIRGICAVADGSGSETQSAGGEGGSLATLRCNDGRVVTGVRGRSGAYVDSLRIECSVQGGQGDPRTTDAVGGSGGAEFGPMRCPRDRIAIGLRGRASAYVDSLQLLCSSRLPDAQLAMPWVSRAVGGSGGVAAMLACSRDRVMVGVSVRSGAWLDSIAARCVSVGANGRWSGTPQSTNRLGGNGGEPHLLDCNENEAVTAISGRAGGYIDRLALRCSALTDALHVADDSAFRGAVGGTGGAPFNRIECPAKLAATGFALRTGAFVDQIKLVCGQ